jgi:hypothetical protein
VTRVSVVEDPEDTFVTAEGGELESLPALPPHPVKARAQPMMKILRMLFTPLALSEISQRVGLQVECQFTGAGCTNYCFINNVCQLQE